MCSVNKKKIISLDKFDTYLVKLYKTPINPIVYNVLLLTSWYILKNNYTLYKNPGFRLVNNWCIFRVFSYLGLISVIFTAAGVLHEDLTFFPSVPWYLRKRISHFYPRVPQTAKFIWNTHKKTKKIKIPQKVYNKLKCS